MSMTTSVCSLLADVAQAGLVHSSHDWHVVEYLHSCVTLAHFVFVIQPAWHYPSTRAVLSLAICPV